jgi:hypothetical protein
MRRFHGLLGAMGLAVLALGVGTAAQDDGIVAEGLLAPRHIAYGADGTLWIAEAGSGGDVETPSPLGMGKAGLTSRVTIVSADGVQEALLGNLPSMDWGFNEMVGVNAVLPEGDALWMAVGNGGGEATGGLNRGVYEWNIETFEQLRVFDTLAAETELNPDGEIIDSNPMDIAVGADGTVYVADAGANTVWQITPDAAELTVFATWTDNPVPTSIEVDAAGDIWIGFLSGFPHLEGSARVEHYTPDGTLVETFEGFTAMVDLALGEDGLYAVQYGVYGDAGFAPSTGSIVTVTDEGPNPVLEGINYPFGLTLSPDGVWMVAYDTNYGQAPEMGRVGTADAVADSEVPVPVATPEVTEDSGENGSNSTDEAIEPVTTPEVTQ